MKSVCMKQCHAFEQATDLLKRPSIDGLYLHGDDSSIDDLVILQRNEAKHQIGVSLKLLRRSSQYFEFLLKVRKIKYASARKKLQKESIRPSQGNGSFQKISGAPTQLRA